MKRNIEMAWRNISKAKRINVAGGINNGEASKAKRNGIEMAYQRMKMAANNG
jgi:hypothetical protein